MLKNYKDLDVWQKAYAFCLDTYQATKKFPAEEKYSLTSQIRRAVLSIPSNIAEGYGRKSLPEYIQFLYMHMVRFVNLKHNSCCQKISDIFLIARRKNLLQASALLNVC